MSDKGPFSSKPRHDVSCSYIEIGRIVQSVLIGEQVMKDRAQLQELVFRFKERTFFQKKRTIRSGADTMYYE